MPLIFVNRSSQQRALDDRSKFGAGSILYYILDGSHQYGKKKMIKRIESLFQPHQDILEKNSSDPPNYHAFTDPSLASSSTLKDIFRSNITGEAYIVLKFSDGYDVKKFFGVYKDCLAGGGKLSSKAFKIKFVFIGSNLRRRIPECFTVAYKVISLTLFKVEYICDLLNQLSNNEVKKHTVDCKAHQILAYSAGHPGLTRRFANYETWDSTQATRDLLQVSHTIKDNFRRIYGYDENNHFFRLVTTSLTVYRTIKKIMPPAILQSLTNQPECQISGVAFYQTLLQVFPNNTDYESGHARPLIYQDTIHRPLFALAYRRANPTSYRRDCAKALSYYKEIALRFKEESHDDGLLHYWVVEFIFLSVEVHTQEEELFVALSEFCTNLFKTLEPQQYHAAMEKVAEKLEDDSEFLYRVNYLFGDQEEWNGDRSARVISYVNYFYPENQQGRGHERG